MTAKATGRPMRQMLSAEEERALIRAWRLEGSTAARDALVEAHEPMLRSMARRFGETPAEREDLRNEGVAALMTALNRFDLDREIRFSTYAVWWILTFMQEYRSGRHLVRIGRSRSDKSIMGRIAYARREFAEVGQGEVGRLIAETLGVSLGDVASVSELLRGAPADIDEQFDLCDPRAGEETVVEALADGDRRRLLSQAMDSCCDERSRAILNDRGFQSPPETYAAIGERLGVSGERVRQIESCAVTEMRRWLAARGLFADDLL